MKKTISFFLSFFLIIHTGGVCLSDCLTVRLSVCLSVGWLVGMCACMHTYDHVCIPSGRQTDRQTACMHRKKERKKSNICNFLSPASAAQLISRAVCLAVCLPACQTAGVRADRQIDRRTDKQTDARTGPNQYANILRS